MDASAPPVRPFPPSGGECTRILEGIDWSQHPLGEPAHWPVELKTAVRLCLTSKFATMVHWGPDLHTFYNDTYAERLGSKHPGHLGQPARDWWSEMWDQLDPFFQKVLEGESYFTENARYTPDRDGTKREAFFTHSHSPIWDDAGRVRGIFLTVVETTAHLAAEARSQVLTNELKHRMKNTMAIVQSIVNQALRRATTMAEAKQTIGAQVGALARTNDLLARSDGLDASLQAIVQGTAEMQGPFSGRITSTGEDVALNPQAAIAFTMLLHELTTNAMKYGALSNDRGRVQVDWQRDGGDLVFSWVEVGGPSVTPPTRSGFGTRLVTALAGDLGGQPQIDYAPEGVRCTLRADADGIAGKPVPFPGRPAS
ncbi:sensor histidine kinase [Pseudoroseicyclus tamaricis]|uniref:histidine kinase n=1 Tax=Pseudoroseicyclus tamaricis TaxID=2705421 RepID=A0A6B2JVR0_9RHOB|nr:PAS domain-containing sensor histidine kinase [Pseudoroseicyclus tamaricis]NDV02190.1 PAS domain-containing protein [Pseudoroseicyclus tamaricis]